MIAGLFLSQSAHAQKQCGIVAHRGFWNCEEAGYAKNSVAALRCAQENGFWGSEFDVNMTSDGVLIVYHDSDVEGKKIEKHPYAQFKDFKIKAYIDPFYFMSETELINSLSVLVNIGALSRRSATEIAYNYGFGVADEWGRVQQQEHDDLVAESAAEQGSTIINTREKNPVAASRVNA